MRRPLPFDGPRGSLSGFHNDDACFGGVAEEGEKTMSKSLRLATAASVALMFTLPARGDMVTAVGKGEGEVDIVAWAGYIERGETDKAYDWVTDFEKETGCKVNVKVAGTSDEMVTLM